MGFKIGHKQSNTGRTHFKKGFTPWNKGKKTGLVPKTAFKKSDPRLVNKNHHSWKGANVSYAGLHMWVKRWLGKPNHCERCGSKNPSIKYQWANKSHTYKRDLNDWIPLCRTCHMVYDQMMSKAWETRRRIYG